MRYFWKRLNGHYWLILGTLSYLCTSIASIIISIEPIGFWPNAYMAVDWLAACVVYFFLGGLIGHLIDWIIAWQNKRRIAHPLWFYLTAALWVISTLVVAITGKSEILDPVSIAFFPLAFGIFFTGYAFTMVFPNAFVKSSYGKLIFDIMFLGIFSAWLYLSLRRKKTRRLILVLLIVLFLVFFLGFAGCAVSLAK